MRNTSHSDLHTYHLWDQLLESDLDLGLPEVSSSSPRSCDIRIRRTVQLRLQECVRTDSLQCSNEDGSIWLAISRSGDAYLLDFPGLCSIRIAPGLRLIEYAPESRAGGSTVVHLLLDHALPRLISMLEEYFVLHASAWALRERAYMVLGQSGTGKSTLVSWFGSKGFPIITDDCLVLKRSTGRQWFALPSYRSVRMWPDSIEAIGIDVSSLREFAHYSTKRRTSDASDVLQFAGLPVQLGGAFVLKPGVPGRCVVEICPVSEAFAALSLGVFRMEIARSEANRREFETLTDLLSDLPFWCLSHGSDYTQLPELQAQMLAVLP